MKDIQLSSGKRRMMRILCMITLITSILMALIGGLIVFIQFDIPGQTVGCSEIAFFRNEEDCRLVGKFGGHAVWLTKTTLASAAVLTNVLDCIAAISMRKMKMAGFRLYMISFVLHIGTLFFVGIDHLPNHEIIMLFPTVGMMLLYLICMQDNNKPASKPIE